MPDQQGDAPEMLSRADLIRQSIIGRLFSKHRKKMSFAILAIGVVVVGSQLADAMPRQVEIRFELPANATSLRAEFIKDGVSQHGVTFGGSEMKNDFISHKVDISKGLYSVQIDTQTRSRVHHVKRALVVPAEGVVTFQAY